MGVGADIVAEINPLVFYCSDPKCSKIHSFKNSDFFLRNKNNKKCKKCGSPLKQLQFSYQCECGWAGSVTSIPCTKHGFDNMKLGRYQFICGTCGKPREMVKSCPECGKRLFPKNALDWGQFIPFTLNLIDLVNTDEESFVYNEELGPKLIIANWLGIINREQLNKYITEKIKSVDEETYNRELNEEINKMKALEIPEEYAVKAAEANLQGKYGKQDIDNIVTEVNSKLINLDDKYLRKIAISLLEYNTILTSDNVSDLNNAIEMARKLNTNSSPERYKDIAAKHGIKYTQVSGKVPFIMCSYGYTRRYINDVYIR
jgi:hypothetical protein